MKSKAERKFTRLFNKTLRKKLAKKVRPQWRLLATSDRQLAPAWSHFADGSNDQSAFTPVRINGVIYWAVASTHPDENLLSKFLLLGPLAIFAQKEGVVVTFWKQNPQHLDHPLNYYRNPRGSEQKPRMYVFSVDDVGAP